MMNNKNTYNCCLVCFCLINLFIHNAYAEPLKSVRQQHDIGLKFNFFPVGTISSKQDNYSTVPALGFSPYYDFRLLNFLWIGAGPEVVLNIIPDKEHSQVGHAINATMRIKFNLSFKNRFALYALLVPGYSFLMLETYDNPKGFQFDALAGFNYLINQSFSIFLESGYKAGFQKSGGNDPSAYAPNYFITALGGEYSF